MDGDRFTIGRGPECDWALNDPDRALSKQHCLITRGQEGFSLTDTSTNGVFLNGSRYPLGRGQVAVLSDGDVIAIGPYQVRMSIQTIAPAVHAALPPALVSGPQAWIGDVLPSRSEGTRAPVQAAWGGPPDPHAMSATGLVTMATSDAFSTLAQQSEAGSPLATVFRVPSAKSVLPLDWDAPASEDNPLGALKPKSVAREVSPTVEKSLVDAFVAGAGLPAGSLDDLDPGVAFHEFGRMLRAATLGLRDLLASRKLAKAELRVPATTVKATANNALKLSTDAERALRAITGQPVPGFLPGVDAIEEGMRDVKAHELALVATVSLLLTDISTQLDPAAIKAKVGGSWDLLSTSKRARFWDEYEAVFSSLAGDAAGATLMGRFAQAYAEQVGQSVSAAGSSGAV